MSPNNTTKLGFSIISHGDIATNCCSSRREDRCTSYFHLFSSRHCAGRKQLHFNSVSWYWNKTVKLFLLQLCFVALNEHQQETEERLARSRTVAGTQKLHCLFQYQLTLLKWSCFLPAQCLEEKSWKCRTYTSLLSSSYSNRWLCHRGLWWRIGCVLGLMRLNMPSLSSSYTPASQHPVLCSLSRRIYWTQTSQMFWLVSMRPLQQVEHILWAERRCRK